MRLQTASRPSILLAAALLLLGACAPAMRAVPLAPEPVIVEEPEELGEDPEILEEVVTETAPEMLGEVPYDLPVEANSWVEGELEFLVGKRAAVIGRWLERGDYYEPFIKSVLEREGLPTDLYHLAMIESGFVPNARSRVGATGLWQFMPATGRLEGLRVDRVVDERLDPVRSTFAAARHLRMLHRSFGGDWALAAAAYNAGSGRISRGLQGYSVDNFWDLAVWGNLAEETKHYVPRLYAMTIIGRDRTRFGFSPPSEERPTFAYDSVQVDVPTPLAELAVIGGVRLEELLRLNPHLLQRTTPPGKYWVWVPSGTGPAVQHAFLGSEYRRSGGFGVYVVRRGDNLGKIAQAAGVPSARIRELNPKTDWNRLQIGARLRMPPGATRNLARLPAADAAVTVASADAAARSSGSGGESGNGASNGNGGSSSPTPRAATRTVEHTVRNGETLSGIARRYGVGVEEIRAANRLKGSTIVTGRKLKIPQAASAATPPTRVASAGGSPSAATRHVVKPGESLWSIAREYGSTVDAIQGANGIDDSRIVPGQRLVIPR